MLACLIEKVRAWRGQQAGAVGLGVRQLHAIAREQVEVAFDQSAINEGLGAGRITVPAVHAGATGFLGSLPGGLRGHVGAPAVGLFHEARFRVAVREEAHAHAAGADVHRRSFDLALIRHVTVARVRPHHAGEVRTFVALRHFVRRLLARLPHGLRTLPRRRAAVPGVAVEHARCSRVVTRQARAIRIGRCEHRTWLGLAGLARLASIVGLACALDLAGLASTLALAGAIDAGKHQRTRIPLAEQRLFQSPVLVGVAPIAVAVPLGDVRAVALPTTRQVKGAPGAFGHDHMVARAQVVQPKRLVPSSRAAPEVYVVAVVPVVAGHIGKKRRLARVHGHKACAALGAREHEPVLVRVVRRTPCQHVGTVDSAAAAGIEAQVGSGFGAQGDDFALPRTIVDKRMVRNQLRCLGRGVYAVGAVGGVAPGAHPGPRPPVPDLPPYAQAVRGIGALEPRAIVGGIVEAARGGLDHTLMEKVVQLKPSAVSLLKVQYRMHEAIMQFPSDWFYHGELEAAPEVRYRGILDFDTPMNWIDTSEMDFHEDFVGESFGRINKQEANLLLQELEAYIERIGKERILDERIDFGLISPYKAQVQYLRGKIKGNSFLRPFRSLITVNTVDGFQGQERDVIFISLVRANEDGQIGFLNDLRRMNVAITRARMKLVILGDASTLTKHPFYKRLMLFIKKED